ncbi:MAG: helix-hairpin-helix domain-containing protein [Saprospiraceae bacterium]|uniref:Helix-hairpin-helix domain-containing protein n=1 Tax=Candidatus Opimibacter skivensis TaxID=2982028 RepID=A0A9D7XTT5_9BACT|nr:helix-hairpin-helix domain-containing protein [Candidatus Opimibacter skivensis]
MLKSLFLASFLFASTSLLLAQEAQDYYNQLIEIISENLESGEEFDYSILVEHIDDWQRKPININSDQVSLLAQWFIISDYAYQQLEDHIRRNGPLLSILELQSIPGFDPATIRILESITNVEGRDMFTQTASPGRLLLHGQNEIYIRGGRTIEKADGYIGDPPAYEGSPDKIYMRLRHRNSNVLSYGITGEKDAGEAFFKGSNKSGFDFYSAHLSLQNYRSWLPAVMLGDFVASFGQGLIMHSGFGTGKSSFVTSIKKTGNPLRPYTSVDENNFLRGIGVTVKPMDNLNVTLFGSKNNRDGNLVVDTIREGGEITDIQADITSLQTANLHRTKSEIADENAIDLTQVGLNISYQSRRTHLGFNALHSSLSSPLNRTPDLYNQYYFNGDKLTNASVDYGFWLSGIHFFGETAISDNGGMATVNGVLAGLDRHILAAILFRSFARDYHSLTPNVFAESSSASNEIGLYTGLEITPSVKWKLQLYHDIWSNPWLRFRVDRPAGGEEIFARLTYTIKRRLEIYAQFRTKKSSLDFTQEGSSIPDVTDQRRSQARLNINNMLDKTIQLRTRLEWSFYDFNSDHENGFLVYQDFLYKPVSSPWSLSGRVVLFDTDSFNTRIYTYENDLIYYYAIPAFSDKGSRYYINLRYKGIRHLTAEIKYARTQWLDMTTVGSGNDEIQGNRRSEIRGQLIYRFEN